VGTLPLASHFLEESMVCGFSSRTSRKCLRKVLVLLGLTPKVTGPLMAVFFASYVSGITDAKPPCPSCWLRW
jgi:hypothetical protein